MILIELKYTFKLKASLNMSLFTINPTKNNRTTKLYIIEIVRNLHEN